MKQTLAITVFLLVLVSSGVKTLLAEEVAPKKTENDVTSAETVPDEIFEDLDQKEKEMDEISENLDARMQELLEREKELEAREKLLEKQQEIALKEKQVKELEKRLSAKSAEPAEEEPAKAEGEIEKLSIIKSGLTDSVDRSWMGSKIGETQNTFSLLKDKQVVWFAQFGAASQFKNILKRPKLTAVWYSPEGKLWKRDEFKPSFGKTVLATSEIDLVPALSQVMKGSWKLEVSYEGDILDKRHFEVTA